MLVKIKSLLEQKIGLNILQLSFWRLFPRNSFTKNMYYFPNVMIWFYFSNVRHDFQYILWEQGQIGIKLGTKHVTDQKLDSFIHKIC